MTDALLDNPTQHTTEQGPMADASSVSVSFPLTKILATLGPSTDNEETLTKLIQTGVTNFRLNFSHGNFDAHKERLHLVRRCAEQLGRPVAVLDIRRMNDEAE